MIATDLRSYMTVTPVYVRADDALETVQEVFSRNSFRHLPVLMADAVVGIISERDVFLALSLASGVQAQEELTAADICTPDPYTVDVNTSFAEVVRIMGERKLGAVIITENEMLAGIVTTTDVCRVCAQLLTLSQH